MLQAHTGHLEVLIVMSGCLQLVLETDGLLLQASSSQSAVAASMTLPMQQKWQWSSYHALPAAAMLHARACL